MRRHDLNTLSKLLITAGIIVISASIFPMIKEEVWFSIKNAKHQDYSLEDSKANSVPDTVFARFLSTRPILMEPVNREFSIVIEKIGVNAPIIPDVSVVDKKSYMDALRYGVAHASFSPYPSKESGNVYLFAHASLNYMRLGKYATVFNLLRKLELKDRVHVFYHGEIYVYEVVNSEIHKGWNTYPITRSVLGPTLTLQTCSPPGTTINRLVVTAILLEVRGE